MPSKRADNAQWSKSIGGKDSHLGIVGYPAGGRYGPVDQGIYQIVGILKGYMTVQADDYTYRVEEHECCLLFPGQRVILRFAAETPCQHNYACLSGKDIPESLIDAFDPANCVARASLHLNELIKLAVELNTSTYIGRDEQVRSICRSTFYEYHRAILEPAGETRHGAIERALTHIYAHYNEDINADSIAKASGLSRQHLSKLLSAETGRAIGEHLWEHRMEKARELLVGTGLQVAEIADQTGFQNPYHMSRKLKQHYGASPKELRARAWAKYES